MLLVAAYDFVLQKGGRAKDKTLKASVSANVERLGIVLSHDGILLVVDCGNPRGLLGLSEVLKELLVLECLAFSLFQLMHRSGGRNDLVELVVRQFHTCAPQSLYC